MANHQTFGTPEFLKLLAGRVLGRREDIREWNRRSRTIPQDNFSPLRCVASASLAVEQAAILLILGRNWQVG